MGKGGDDCDCDCGCCDCDCCDCDCCKCDCDCCNDCCKCECCEGECCSCDCCENCCECNCCDSADGSTNIEMKAPEPLSMDKDITISIPNPGPIIDAFTYNPPTLNLGSIGDALPDFDWSDSDDDKKSKSSNNNEDEDDDDEDDDDDDDDEDSSDDEDDKLKPFLNWPLDFVENTRRHRAVAPMAQYYGEINHDYRIDAPQFNSHCFLTTPDTEFPQGDKARTIKFDIYLPHVEASGSDSVSAIMSYGRYQSEQWFVIAIDWRNHKNELFFAEGSSAFYSHIKLEANVWYSCALVLYGGGRAKWLSIKPKKKSSKKSRKVVKTAATVFPSKRLDTKSGGVFSLGAHPDPFPFQGSLRNVLFWDVPLKKKSLKRVNARV